MIIIIIICPFLNYFFTPTALRNTCRFCIDSQNFIGRPKVSRGQGGEVPLFQRFAWGGEIPGHDPGDVGVCNGAAPRQCVQRVGKGTRTHTRALHT